jgi:HEAT repeat protein
MMGPSKNGDGRSDNPNTAANTDDLMRVLLDKGQDIQTRRHAARVLGSRCNTEAFLFLARVLTDQTDPITLLIQLLRHPDSFAYSGAASALGDLGDPRAVEPLLEILPYAAPGADQSIIWALGKIGDKRALTPLLDRLVTGDWRERSWAASALGELGAAEAVKPLIKAFRQGVSIGDSCTWQSALRALGKIRDDRALDLLLEAITHQDREVRCIAIYSLGTTGDPRAIDPIIEALEDPVPFVRQHAIWALGEIGDPEVIPALLGLLEREPAQAASFCDVRGAAMEALSRLEKRKGLLPDM